MRRFGASTLRPGMIVRLIEGECATGGSFDDWSTVSFMTSFEGLVLFVQNDVRRDGTIHVGFLERDGSVLVALSYHKSVRIYSFWTEVC